MEESNIHQKERIMCGCLADWDMLRLMYGCQFPDLTPKCGDYSEEIVTSWVFFSCKSKFRKSIGIY